MADQYEIVTHFGCCHCKAVQFMFYAPADLVAWDCNCSVCAMRRNVHTIVPESRFSLLMGEDKLTLYQFGSKTAKHLFCKVCGISAFYNPRSNPDGVAINIGCISPGTVNSMDVRSYDGQNWDAAHAATGISAQSKAVAEA